jgi:hypothetical protein
MTRAVRRTIMVERKRSTLGTANKHISGRPSDDVVGRSRTEWKERTDSVSGSSDPGLRLRKYSFQGNKVISSDRGRWRARADCEIWWLEMRRCCGVGDAVHLQCG